MVNNKRRLFNKPNYGFKMCMYSIFGGLTKQKCFWNARDTGSGTTQGVKAMTDFDC